MNEVTPIQPPGAADAVYAALSKKALQRTSLENVQDTLEALQSGFPARTLLQIEMDLWPALRNSGVKVTLWDLQQIIAALEPKHSPSLCTTRRD